MLDAGLLSSRVDGVEWSLFVAEVGACGWRDPVLGQLLFLRDVLDVPVPHDVIEGIRALRPSVPMRTSDSCESSLSGGFRISMRTGAC